MRAADEYARFGRATGLPPHVPAGYRALFPTVADAHVRLLGDHVLAEPTTRPAERHGARPARFTRPPAWHAGDVPFAFGTPAGAAPHPRP
ncbi:hypothetical protein [Saccharothrix australiensis]|uniref:Uncharacterized protein n=1 Tax=Saccharothrix australiensis TaxID=2072 RepID=A0A495W324_9PSEU|nr:hypothetical protein [Saccharothrix australiensis]RKT55889.1 hypothetical protein C8E97_4577 [Saccharothrix australiensis]